MFSQKKWYLGEYANKQVIDIDSPKIAWSCLKHGEGPFHIPMGGPVFSNPNFLDGVEYDSVDGKSL